MAQPPRVLPPLSPELRSAELPRVDLTQQHGSHGENQLDPRLQAVQVQPQMEYSHVRVQSQTSVMSPQIGERHMMSPQTSERHQTHHATHDDSATIHVASHAGVQSTVLPVYYSVDGVPHMLPSGVMSGQPIAVPATGSLDVRNPSNMLNEASSMQQIRNVSNVGSSVHSVNTVESETVRDPPLTYNQHTPASVQGLVVVPMYSGTDVVPSESQSSSQPPTHPTTHPVTHPPNFPNISTQFSHPGGINVNETIPNNQSDTYQQVSVSVQPLAHGGANMQQLSPGGADMQHLPQAGGSVQHLPQGGASVQHLSQGAASEQSEVISDVIEVAPPSYYKEREQLQNVEPNVVDITPRQDYLHPVPPSGLESRQHDQPNLSYYTLRQRPMHMDLGPCSSEFRTYFHRQQGSKQLHHFISELLSLERFLPPECCFLDEEISSWSLEYYDPEYTDVLDKLSDYSTRHRLSSPASGLEQLLALYVKSCCCEGQFRKPSDVADFECLVSPTVSHVSVQTDTVRRESTSSKQNDPLVIDESGLSKEDKPKDAVAKKRKKRAKLVVKKKTKKAKQSDSLPDPLPDSLPDTETNTEDSIQNTAETSAETQQNSSNLSNTETAGVVDECSVESAPDVGTKPAQEGKTVTEEVNIQPQDTEKEVDTLVISEHSEAKAKKTKPKQVPKKRKLENDGTKASGEDSSKAKVKDAPKAVPKTPSKKKQLPPVTKCDISIQVNEFAEVIRVYEESSTNSRKKNMRHKSEQIGFTTCMVCGITFSDIQEYEKHEEEHPSSAQYYCEVCDVMFSNKAHFLQHGMKHYGMMDYKCSHCQWYFQTMKHLKDHFAELVPIVRCPVCQESLTRSTLNKHLIQHIKGNYPVLQLLHGHRPAMFLMAESELSATEKEPGEETIEKGSKKGAEGRGSAVDKDRPLRPWMIKDMLGEEVKAAEIYQDLQGDVIPLTKFQGEEVLHQGKPINCYTLKTKIPCVHSECDVPGLEQAYNGKALYFPPNTRAVVRSGVLKFYTKETFQCTVCDKSFSKKIYLNDHHKFVHLQEFTHQCDKCAKTFIHSTDLGQHIRKCHDDPVNHKCNLCSKIFKTQEALTTHQEVHDCGKAVCNICQKSFNKRYLREHINFVHKQIKTKCNFCGKSFATATARRRCEKIHWGKKNYLCADCGKSYYVISDLIQHRKHHHSEENT